MNNCQESDLEVRTLNGLIKGKHMTTVFGKKVKVFHHIPYMKPPIGKLRFKDPQPVENWNTLLDCTIESQPTVNFDVFAKAVVGDEDALYMNAYTKNTNPEKLSPVIIWIHGGAFITGSSTSDLYSPDFLLEKDIVFFSFNFRMSPFGFLSLEDPELEVPGNAGLKDQTMALRWIKANAHVFGGDPNNITAFGISAGGVAVHFHMISDLSKDLFHKGVVMSGSALFESALQTTTTDLSLELAKKFGWQENEGTQRALEILQNANSYDIITAVNSLLPMEDKMHTLQFNFVPSIEPYTAEQSFLTKSPREAMQNAWGDRIPIITGTTSQEGLVMFMFHKGIETDEYYTSLGDFQIVVDIHLGLEKDSMEKKRFGAALKQLYYNNETPNAANNNNYIDMMGDRHFVRGVYELVKRRANNALCAPTYFYRFDFDDPFAQVFKNDFGITKPGVAHAMDWVYILKMSTYHQNGGLKPGSAALKTMQRMVGILTSFAVTGNPNCSEMESMYWEPVNRTTHPFQVLNISNELSIIDSPESDRLIALDNIFKSVGK